MGEHAALPFLLIQNIKSLKASFKSLQVASADVSMVAKAIDSGFVPVSLNPLMCNKTWNLDILYKFLFLCIF